MYIKKLISLRNAFRIMKQAAIVACNVADSEFYLNPQHGAQCCIEYHQYMVEMRCVVFS